MSTIKKEWHLVLLTLIPIVYLGTIYNSLANEVPIHWDVEGQIDGYGAKSILLVLAAIPLAIYLFFNLIPKIDSKKGLSMMGNKYQKIKNTVVVFIVITVVYLLHLAANPNDFESSLLSIGIGALYLLLGNYLKTIKANYFIGIRTPWTMKNELVWKKTHVVGGQLWFVGGGIILLYTLIGWEFYNLHILLLITALIVVVPVLYSYIVYKQVQKIES